MNFLYMIFIYPVYMFVEFVLFLANNITDDYAAFSIILLSIAVNVICLPMYNVAECWQEKERSIQKKMKPKIADIKAVFKGDERYMILSTYYRQNNYHPLYALRGMFALFIQIPFFIAAYQLLSGLPMLHNCSFWLLTDLSKPDGLLYLAERHINVLPILMTLINIAASTVYTKGLALKDKITLYSTALIFLVLLYNSPSGLVFYWTLNNLFSLLKNIFYRIKLNGKVWYLITVVCCIFFTVLVHHHTSKDRPVVVAACFTAVIIAVPIIGKVFSTFFFKNMHAVLADTSFRFRLFLHSSLALFLFLGLVIPALTIASSPLEFVHFEGIENPFTILLYTSVQSLGCLFWFVCIYKLFNGAVQKAFTCISIMVLAAALLNVFIFQDGYGSINNLLMFSDAGKLRHSLHDVFINLAVIGLTACTLFIVIYSNRFISYIASLIKIIIASFLVISCMSFVTIYTELSSLKVSESAVPVAAQAYRISKRGKNIIILMLDRSMNFFIDPIFEHSQLVKKEYTGFTVFENSIAFGTSTNFSTPSLFGGYEYTPENLNKRDTELLVDKHNEALSVLPRLFSEHDWLVSFTDPSWLNYKWIPDLSVFARYSMIAKNIDGNALYTQDFLKKRGIGSVQSSRISGIRRNMLYFSFFKILPIEVRRIFYAEGMYGGVGIPIYSAPFMNAYSAIEHLTDEVEFVPEGNCINIIVNNTTHDPPREGTTRMIGKESLIPLAKQYCLNEYTAEHFYANYLAHESCAHFFRFLKDNGCWNNTRIIIAGDHGRYSMHTAGMDFLKRFEGTGFSPESSIPLLMMKDFNQEGALQKDYTFMTLADIPILATKGLTSALQKNPFSGKTFLETQQKASVKIVTGGNWQASSQLKFTQFEDAQWAYVKENVYDPKNWSKAPFRKNE